MKLHVYVTQEDIDQGIRGSGDKCPVARALNRRFKRPVVVTHMGIWKPSTEPERSFDWYHQFGNDTVLDWIKKFDKPNTNRRYLKPFRFTLKLDQKASKWVRKSEKK